MEYKKLGRFHLKSQVAQGGMGEIIRSVDDSGRTVALKKILKDHSEDESIRALFFREAEITFRLKHPNIVEAYGFRTIGNQPVLELEFLEGANLRSLLRECNERNLSIPITVAVAIVDRILLGLHYAHEARDENGPLEIVHRDLNPSNIFVTRRGQIKILDFGISKATRKDAHQLSGHGEIRGKISYLSPEQIQGEKIDRRTDLYSVGIMLWELLTSRPLFYCQTDSEVLEMIMAGDLKSPKDYRSDLPGELASLVMKALQTKPKARYQTSEEFRHALRSFMKNNELPMATENEISAFARWVSRDVTLFQDPKALGSYAWLLCQAPSTRAQGLEVIRPLVEQNATVPDIQLAYARCLLAAKKKEDAFRVIKRLSRAEGLEGPLHELLTFMGVRRPPVFRGFERSHPLNKVCGRIRHRVLGPTKNQLAFQAA